MDKVSPLMDFNMHSMNDLLPYAFCCAGGAMTCELYEKLRPSMATGQEYELPVPGNVMTILYQNNIFHVFRSEVCMPIFIS